MSVEVVTGIFTALLAVVIFTLGGQILTRIERLDATLRAAIHESNARIDRGSEKLHAEIRNVLHRQLNTTITKLVQIENQLDRNRG